MIQIFLWAYFILSVGFKIKRNWKKWINGLKTMIKTAEAYQKMKTAAQVELSPEQLKEIIADQKAQIQTLSSQNMILRTRLSKMESDANK